MRRGTSIARPAGLYRLPDELIFPANFQAIGASITKPLSPGPLDAETRGLVGLVASAMPCRDDSVTYHLLRCGEEGWFHDAFARLHRCFEADVRKWKAGGKFVGDGSKYASIEDGWMGIAFIETCVKSSARKGAWTALPKMS